MKKIYLSILGVCLSVAVFAQAKSYNMGGKQFYHHTPKVSAAAPGDTLFLFDGNGFFITNPDDQNDFAYANTDVDGLTPYNAQSGWESDFNFFYSLDPNDFTPGWDVDSAFFFGATSWFDPPGQADNWFSFGPITIPTGGAKITFLNKSNPAYTDGFKVLVSTTGLDAYTDLDPQTSPQIFSKADCLPPGCTQPASDTVWTEHEASLSNWATERVYIGFWHNTNDGDVFWLDHIVITETDDVGLNEANEFGNKLYQNQPNPTDRMTTIKYQLGQYTEKVEIEVFDVTGRKVHEVNVGEQGAGKHSLTLDASVLSSGTYYYTLKTGDNRLTKKMIVTK